mmetsp:Transcript_62657/g.99192  ORF Transcript_62657/g.99192 Transcript_62657/m.99192 type:complete len:328 (+) Transcript_62657:298-1281(+)
MTPSPNPFLPSLLSLWILWTRPFHLFHPLFRHLFHPFLDPFRLRPFQHLFHPCLLFHSPCRPWSPCRLFLCGHTSPPHPFHGQQLRLHLWPLCPLFHLWTWNRLWHPHPSFRSFPRLLWSRPWHLYLSFLCLWSWQHHLIHRRTSGWHSSPRHVLIDWKVLLMHTDQQFRILHLVSQATKFQSPGLVVVPGVMKLGLPRNVRDSLVALAQDPANVLTLDWNSDSDEFHLIPRSLHGLLSCSRDCDPAVGAVLGRIFDPNLHAVFFTDLLDVVALLSNDPANQGLIHVKHLLVLCRMPLLGPVQTFCELVTVFMEPLHLDLMLEVNQL